jgi:hypothetical protein
MAVLVTALHPRPAACRCGRWSCGDPGGQSGVGKGLRQIRITAGQIAAGDAMVLVSGLVFVV